MRVLFYDDCPVADCFGMGWQFYNRKVGHLTENNNPAGTVHYKTFTLVQINILLHTSYLDEGRELSVTPWLDKPPVNWKRRYCQVSLKGRIFKFQTHLLTYWLTF